MPRGARPCVHRVGDPVAWLEEQTRSGATGAVEIPMIGVGASLNVAVAGTLVLYRLAGLA